MPKTPDLYRKELSLQGGFNPYGEPNFILHWGGNAICRPGLPDTLLAPWLDCWVLAQWRPANDFGVPIQWLSDLLEAPYPSRGLYVIIQTFHNGTEPAMLDSPALNVQVLKGMVHVVKTHESDDFNKRMLTARAFKDKELAAQRARIADCLEAAAPAFGESASFNGQRNCNTALAQKMEQIERNYPFVEAFRRQRGLSYSIGA